MPKCDSLLKSSMGLLADGHRVILALSGCGRDGFKSGDRNEQPTYMHVQHLKENSQHSKAEKLKDRAGQIDLVKQAAPLAWAYSPDVSWPSMTGFPKILSWRCDLTSSGADCSWQFCSLHFLLLPCLLRHQGTRKFDFLATFLSFSFVGYFLEFGLWEVLVIYWHTGSGDTCVLTAQFTRFWTAWTIDFLGMSVRGWELLLGSGRLNESRFEAMVAVVFTH